MSEKDLKLEEFLDIIDKLSPAARRDILDMSVFIVWRETGKPAPWQQLIRGAWIYMGFTLRFALQKRFERKKGKA